MSLTLKKDPAKRFGGWALVRLPAGAAGATMVAVRRADTEEWLGAGAWQGGRHAFGPYPVETGAGGAFVRIGPEIVDRMEPYLPFTLSLPDLGLEAALDWPEDIPPAPKGSEGVGVAAPKRPASDLSRRVGGAAPQAAPEQSPAAPPSPPPAAPPPAAPPPVAAPRAAEPAAQAAAPKAAAPVAAAVTAAVSDPQPVLDPGRRRRSSLPLVAALLALAAGGAALWWFALRPDAATEASPPVVAEPQTPTPPPAAPPVAEAACVRDQVAAALRAAEPDLAGLRALVGLCRDAGDADLEVRVLEKLAGLNDPAALVDFGRRYDPRETGAPRSFGAPDAANAATYYARAVEAGSADAAADLTALCTHLRGVGDAASRMVLAIHCE